MKTDFFFSTYSVLILQEKSILTWQDALYGAGSMKP